MKVPMVDLRAQYQQIKKPIDSAIKNVIRESAFVGGHFVEDFESQMAKYLKVRHVVSLNSGTDAIYLSLLALGAKKDWEIITTPFTFFATAEVIVKLGAKPVFVDIDPQTYNIDPTLIEKAITKKTRAIMPVHLFGLPADMDKIMKIAKKHKLYVIEDACQAIGAEYSGKKVGTLGDVGAFSFFPSKNLGAYGDGGMIATNNQDLADKIRILRNHGSKTRYYNDYIGENSRLDGLQAAILSVKLKYLDSWNRKRFKVAQTYNRLLSDIPDLVLPDYRLTKGTTHIFHQYTVRVQGDRRDSIKKILEEKGIASMIYYPVPLHFQKALSYLKPKPGKLANIELASKEVLSLPIYPEISEMTLRRIGKVIRNAIRKGPETM